MGKDEKTANQDKTNKSKTYTKQISGKKQQSSIIDKPDAEKICISFKDSSSSKISENATNNDDRNAQNAIYVIRSLQKELTSEREKRKHSEQQTESLLALNREHKEEIDVLRSMLIETKKQLSEFEKTKKNELRLKKKVDTLSELLVRKQQSLLEALQAVDQVSKKTNHSQSTKKKRRNVIQRASQFKFTKNRERKHAHTISDMSGIPHINNKNYRTNLPKLAMTAHSSIKTNDKNNEEKEQSKRERTRTLTDIGDLLTTNHDIKELKDID